MYLLREELRKIKNSECYRIVKNNNKIYKAVYRVVKFGCQLWDEISVTLKTKNTFHLCFFFREKFGGDNDLLILSCKQFDLYTFL